MNVFISEEWSCVNKTEWKQSSARRGSKTDKTPGREKKKKSFLIIFLMNGILTFLALALSLSHSELACSFPSSFLFFRSFFLHLVSIYKIKSIFQWFAVKKFVPINSAWADSDNIFKMLCKLKCELLRYFEYDELDLEFCNSTICTYIGLCRWAQMRTQQKTEKRKLFRCWCCCCWSL